MDCPNFCRVFERVLLEMEIKNAVITGANISIERGFILDMWLTLDYGGVCQGFGGYALYVSKESPNHKKESVAGHFIYRCLEIADVESFDKLKGKTIRVRSEDGQSIDAIGHIVKDDWFNPKADFAK